MIPLLKAILKQKPLLQEPPAPASPPVERIYDPTAPQENVIFSDTPRAESISIIQRVRTMFWFYPDFTMGLLHKLRPLSYIGLYALFFFVGRQTIIYARNNNDSVLNTPPPQILHEGVVGSISSINPLYVTHNQIERDLQSLVFNKLVTIGADGNPRPELARTWAITGDGKQFTFFLRKDVRWHDGSIFSADDVIFTFETIQRLDDEDSYSNEFKGVTFGKIDDFTVVITLPQTNPTLMDSLAFNIVPKHLLNSIEPADIRFSTFNQYPIGTGPFKVLRYDNDILTLTRNENYFRGEPLLTSIIYHFFSTEADARYALEKFQIHSLSNVTGTTLHEISEYPSYTKHSFIMRLRQKLIFFSLNHQGPISSAVVREALSAATDRNDILDSIPEGGEISLGPIPPTSWAYDTEADRFPFNQARAQTLLDKAGWKLPTDDDQTEGMYRTKGEETLSIKLTFLDTPVNNLVAEILKAQWADVGVQLIFDAQNYDKISSEIVPRRNFDALLFEIEYTPDPDKYNLWHSSQVEYPGLNLYGYSYDRVDILLERARTELDKDVRKQDYDLFQQYLLSEMPALYLYYPRYVFIAHDRVKGIELQNATLPQQRYTNIEYWYIE